MKKILAILFFSFCISIPVILPFFHAGYFPSHDGEWAVVRLGDMFRTLRDFQIPARYSGNLNFGYGYPLFNFTYPFPYYLGVVIHSVGIGFVDTIKILFAASVVLSAFFMFLASQALWKNTWSGIISAVVYIYFPYRMVDLYVRGSIGESLSFALFPLLFYLAVKLLNKSSALLIGSIAIFIGVLIMTHNIMTVLFMPVFIVFIISQIILNKRKAIKPFVISLFLGLGISAFFWIPALFEKNNILLSKIPIADRNLYFLTPDQFFFPRWGYGAPTDPDGFSYQFGLVHIAILFLIILSLLFILFKKKNLIKENFVKIAILLASLTLSFAFLLFKPSDFLWKNLPLLSEINYPWIILGILGFLISLLSGFICKHSIGRYVMVFLGAIAVIVVLPYAKPSSYIDKGDDYYLTNDATTTSSNELMPLWVKKLPKQRALNKVEMVRGNGNIDSIQSNSRQVSFSANILSDSLVRINRIYFPGWSVYVDGVNTSISYSSKEGVMDIPVVSGRHNITANFGETKLRMISNIVSVFSIFALLFLVLNSRFNPPSRNFPIVKPWDAETLFRFGRISALTKCIKRFPKRKLVELQFTEKSS